MSERNLVAELREAIHQARARVYQVGDPTPLQPMSLEGIADPVWVKREDLGPVKAYKWRGAYNAMACLTAEKLAQGVVAASAGNHAQGIALGARALGCEARIFMPKPTPLVKRKAVMAHGGEKVTIELVGDSFSEAQAAALKFAAKSEATFIPPYDSLDTMGGQGTLADEIFTSGEGPFDRVYVAIGGGGLASAVASWLKSSWPGVKVIGVEGVDQASMKAAIANGGPTYLDYVDLFCDGTAVNQVGDLTYEICRTQIDEIITVTNQEVSSAIKAHWDGLRVIPEPSGAMSLAGYLQQQRDGLVPDGEKVLTILCGANMDFAKVAEISRQAGITPKQKRSWLFEIPEEKGSLVNLLIDLPNEVSIIDLQYGRSSGEVQSPVLTLDVPSQDEAAFSKWLEEREGYATDVTDQADARYRVIPFSPSIFTSPLFVEVEFFERAGALLQFMKEVSPLASLCYFNYIYSGERVGRALVGLDFFSEAEEEAGKKLILANAGKKVRSVKEVTVGSRA
ncbi:pyridoxal-phosphate dependent enzyme [Akkermansiaceae bacterium]|nr:pyridoxal-phosphate dependent enzyme [Akkermansiaceae bacterium]MDB4364215.1 pyridoxal-phosphate dependent enzyme [Akkermansiaceae bacterium]